MKDFDDLISRLTRRLRPDPDLQMEVAHELRTHLEDSAAEFQAAGRNPDEAHAAAVKALGDENEVADKLWQANHRRMRVRQVVKWAAGVGLMPAAVAVSLSVAWGAVISLATLLVMASGPMAIIALDQPPNRQDGLAGQLAAWHSIGMIDALPAQSRAVFDAPMGNRQQAVSASRRLADEHPGDPLYWANYTLQTLSALTRSPEGLDPRAAMTALEAAEQGAKIEPDNGFYPLMAAWMRLSLATQTIARDDKTPPDVVYRDAAGKEQRDWWGRYKILDQAEFAQAMAQMHEAARKPYIDSHVWDFLRFRLGVLPAVSGLGDQILRWDIECETLLPYLAGYRAVIDTAGWHARELAATDKRDQALAIVDDEQSIARLAAARSRCLIDLMVAFGLDGAARFTREIILEGTNPVAYAKAVAHLQQRRDGLYGVRRNVIPDALVDQGGYFALSVMPVGVKMAGIDLGPERRAEYAVLDRAVLTGMLLALLCAAMWLAADAIEVRIRTRRWPAVLIAGWGATARVVLVSTLLPVGVYALYAWLPIGRRAYGPPYSSERLAVEYAAVACAIVILLRALGEAANRKRAREIDASHTRDRARFWKAGQVRMVIGTGLALAVLVFFITWNGENRSQYYVGPLLTRGWGWMLAGALLFYAASWLWPAMKDLADDGRVARRRIVTTGVACGIGVALGAAAIRISWSTNPSEGWLWRIELPLMAVTIAYWVAILAVPPVMCGARLVREMMAARSREPGGTDAPPEFSTGLSLVPSVLMTAILLAAIGGPVLRLRERQAAVAMEAPAANFDISGEIERGGFDAARERLIAGK